MSTIGWRDDRINSVIADYLEREAAGQNPSRDELLAQHPDLATELTAFFRDHDAARRTARPPGVRVRYFGDYEIEDEIGRGAMGVVYRARQVSLNRIVALKMILTGQFASTADVQRFRTEAENAANLDHPNIVPLYEVGEHEGQHYFSMKFIEGTSLSRAAAGGMSAREAAQLVATVARAVQHAHDRGILHRDLKPGNILLGQTGSTLSSSVPFVTDFGLARRLDATSSLSPSGAIIGTPAYMAPEQAAPSRSGITVAADIYGLGGVLYECLTGRPPFTGESPLDVLQQVVQREPSAPTAPRDLEQICLKCLRKEPNARYASAAALADDLERFLRGEPVVARPVGLVGRGVRWTRRNPAVATLLFVVMVTVLAGVAFSSAFAVQANRNARQAQDQAKRAEAEMEKAREARDAADAARRHAEVMALTAHQTVVLPTDPALALLLGLEAAQRADSRTALHNNALRAAVQQCRELRTLRAPDALAVDSRLKTHDGFTSVRFSPDGRILATTSERFFREGTRYAGTSHKTARLWDVATGRVLHTFTVPGLAFHSLEFSPDGKRLATTQEAVVRAHYADGRRHVFSDRAVRLWDVETGKELRVFRGHTNRVVWATFSPNGRRLATASWDNTARVWDVETGEQLHLLRGDQRCVLGVEWSADGRRLLTFTDAGERHSDGPRGVRSPAADWDPLVPEASVVKFDTFGFGGGQSGGGNDRVQLWDAVSGLPIALTPTPTVAAGEGMKAIFSPDGKRVLLYAEQEVALHDAGDGKRVGVVAKTGPLMRFSTEGAANVFALSGTEQPTVWRLDANGNPMPRSARDAVSGLLYRSAGDFLPAASRSAVRGSAVVAVLSGAVVTVRTIEDGRVIAELKGHQDRVAGCAFTPDGGILATASLDGTVRLWDLTREDSFARVLNGGSETGWARFTTDGRILTAARSNSGGGSEIAIWENSADRPAVLERNEDLRDRPLREALLGGLRDAQLSPDGRLLVTVHHDRNPRSEAKEVEPKPSPLFTPVRIWDLEKGKLVHALSGLSRSVRTAVFSPDGKRLLTYADGFDQYALLTPKGELWGTGGGGSGKAEVRLWDVATGKPLRSFHRDDQYCLGAILSPDGRRVAVGGSGVKNVAEVWDAEDGRLLVTCDPKPGMVDRLSYSPDGRWLIGHREAIIKDRDKVVIWDADSGKVQTVLSAHRDEVLWVGCTPDGRILTTGSDGTVRAWDPASGKQLLQLVGHEREVLTASASRDGRWLATGSADHTARLWDARTGREWMTLEGHRDRVTTVEFSADGQTVVTASPDGTARVWPVDPLPLARMRRPRDWTSAERERFLPD